MAFSGDGTRLVAVTDRASVWNVPARTHVCSVAEDWGYTAYLSHDASVLAGSSLTGAFARFDAASCVLRAEGSADTGGTFGAAPDARWVASSAQGHGLKIHVLDPKGERDMKTPVTTCAHHVSPAFSEDGKSSTRLGDGHGSANEHRGCAHAPVNPPPVAPSQQHLRVRVRNGYDRPMYPEHHWPTTLRVFALGVVSSACLWGCGSSADAARDEFGRQWSCPLESVQVTPKPDVRWSTLAFNPVNAEPSAEVKADPARLAKRKQDQEAQVEPLRASLDTFDVLSATGCGHTSLLGCKRPAKSNGKSRIICQVAPEKTAK